MISIDLFQFAYASSAFLPSWMATTSDTYLTLTTAYPNSTCWFDKALGASQHWSSLKGVKMAKSYVALGAKESFFPLHQGYPTDLSARCKCCKHPVEIRRVLRKTI